jgi:hypothetical protein
MDEIKLGYVHLCTCGGPYAYVSSRMRFKFWRWKITAIYIGREDSLLVANLTKLGAIGVLKLLGVSK